MSRRPPLRAAALVLAVVAASLAGGRAASQQAGDDVVYLRDGRSLRGTIVERVPGESVTILLKDGVVFTIPRSQIARTRDRSVLRYGAEGVPSIDLPPWELQGRWVRVQLREGSVEGRVIWPDTGELVLREAGTLLTRERTRIPRSNISGVLVSMHQSRGTFPYALASGAAWFVAGALFAGAFGGTSTDMLITGGAGAAVLGIPTGAIVGFFVVRHDDWRRLNGGPPASPVSAGPARVQVGARVSL